MLPQLAVKVTLNKPNGDDNTVAYKVSRTKLTYLTNHYALKLQQGAYTSMVITIVKAKGRAND